MPDRLPALQTFLRNQTSVYALVRGRIYLHEIPDQAVAQMPRACLVIRSAGGSETIGGGLMDFSDERVDIRHYNTTPASARKLYLAVKEVLRNMTRTTVGDTLLHWCRLAGGPNDMREPGAGWPGGVPDSSIHWPFVMASWQVLAADIPVPTPS